MNDPKRHVLAFSRHLTGAKKDGARIVENCSGAHDEGKETRRLTLIRPINLTDPACLDQLAAGLIDLFLWFFAAASQN